MPRAATAAHRHQGVFLVGARELVHGLGEQHGAGAAERVTEGDGAAVGVHRRHVGLELLLPGEDHRGEGLVDLDQVDVAHLHALVRQQLLGGVDRAREHQHRVGTDQAGVDDGRLRRDAEGFGLLARHQQDGRGAIGDLRRRAGRVDAVGQVRLQAAEALERGLAKALVALDPVGRAQGLSVLAEVRGVDRQDLRIEAVLVPGLRGAVLGELAEGVGVGPGQTPLLRDALGTLELGGELVVRPVGLGDRLPDEWLLGNRRAHVHAAHDLDAAPDGAVDHATRHEGVSEVGRLLR